MATTALSNAFGFIQMRPGQRKQGNKRLLRGVRAEAVTSLAILQQQSAAAAD
jgi:hypothetical protein